jgi:hypothetical protein
VTKLLDIYAELLKWDIEVMSQPWMYWCLLIPIIGYLPFFFMKWLVLTAPFWIPFGMIYAAAVKK